MDRASDSGSEGWGFESLPVYQNKQMGYPLGYPSYLFGATRRKGLERAAPVRTLVQKLRAGEQFLARGRIHGLVNAPGWVWAQVHFIYPITFYFTSVMGMARLAVLKHTSIPATI